MTVLVRGACALLMLVVVATAQALPPTETVLSNLERFRAATGDVGGRGQIDYVGLRGAVELVRRLGEPPLLRVGETELAADWRDGELDVVLRLVGVVLGASDLSEALAAMGRPLTEQIDTLAFLGDDVVWVIGGAPGAPTARLWVERETYRLRLVEVPMPEGMYAVALDDYSLAEGWFPSRITIARGEREVLRLWLQTLSRL